MVRVIKGFKADGEERTRLKAGLEGVINEIDIYDGQALILFLDRNVQQWVKPKHFKNLEVV